MHIDHFAQKLCANQEMINRLVIQCKTALMRGEPDQLTRHKSTSFAIAHTSLMLERWQTLIRNSSRAY